MLIYIACPNEGEPEENFNRARRVSVELAKMGHAVICPHLSLYRFNEEGLNDELILKLCLDILARCDALVMLTGAENGAMAEQQFAEARKIPVYSYPEVPSLHPTEVKRPEQASVFIDFIMRMYRLHLKKNADYSPANIKATGQIGLVTRLWDKMARLMNLTGFKFDIVNERFEAPSEPECESIEDSFIDLATYGVIAQIYGMGAWGK